MRQVIGNPLSWTVRAIRDVMHTIGNVGGHVGGITQAAHEPPAGIRHLETEDIEYALQRGFEDFKAMRSDAVFLVVVYPIIGIAMVALALQSNAVHLIYPAVTGFVLVGPLAAIGLYEISKRREAGLDPSWGDAFKVFRSESIGPIFILGLGLILIFAVWIAVARGIYALTLGPEVPESFWALIATALTTPAGWALIIIGTGIGALFALFVLAISVISFPLLVDRETTIATAVLTSVRVTRHNPGVILTWGVVVALMLLLGSLPLFLGLVVALPVLGHATWHLYRRAVVPADMPAQTDSEQRAGGPSAMAHGHGHGHGHAPA